MNMNLLFTEQSETDMDDIWDYIAHDSIDAADRFIDQIHEKCRLLAETPGMGRKRSELVEGVRSFPLGNYLIFYHTQDDTTFIDRVLSGYRNLSVLFEE